MLSNRPPTTAEAAHRPALVWEDTACPLCGRDDVKLLGEAADPLPPDRSGLRFAIVRCRHCGLAYTNPRPTAETIGRFYPANYLPHESREGRRVRAPSRFWSRVFGRPCPERRGLLARIGTGRLLDFGCGSGSYLERMADRGWRVTGLDTSPRVVQALRHDRGFDARLGTLPHPDLAPGSFDVVTMWQALEHVHRPLAVLRAAHELLVPGGMIVIAVPNLDSLAAYWFGEHWFGLDLPRHLTHFTPKTLTEMLRVAGFRVESVRGLVHAEWLRVSAMRAGTAGTGGLGAFLVRWKALSRVAAWGCYMLGRADCTLAIAERPA
jgi:2-polyprenyl-3-methyl-5-hydroxy-6-metoxy-1,4-benzoquinol methylase